MDDRIKQKSILFRINMRRIRKTLGIIAFGVPRQPGRIYRLPAGEIFTPNPWRISLHWASGMHFCGHSGVEDECGCAQNLSSSDPNGQASIVKEHNEYLYKTLGILAREKFFLSEIFMPAHGNHAIDKDSARDDSKRLIQSAAQFF